MVDKPRCEKLLGKLCAFLVSLRKLARVPRDEFLASEDKLGNAKYSFVVAIEACVDIANHIISSEGLRFPTSNQDSFVVLIEHGVLSEERRDSFRAMARFRNRLVHMYWDVDDDFVYQYLQDCLDDLDAFAADVSGFLRQSS